MINRRHIRIKVMQSFYALLQSENQDLKLEEKFLINNINKMQELYLLMLSLLVEIKNESSRILLISKQKHLATQSELNPNQKFINNSVLMGIIKSPTFQTYNKNLKTNFWIENHKFVKIIWEAIATSDVYATYMESEISSVKDDLNFIENIYANIIVVNEKLYDLIEDTNIGWVDDFPFVNTWLLKSIKHVNSTNTLRISRLFRDIDDEKFVLELFRAVLDHHQDFDADIDGKTPNWDSDRIAELDLILIKMALTEFVYFSSIPTKVSINEYLEIAKDYSTEKSSIFINGVLDKLLKEYQKENKIEKVGRGLL